MTHRSRIGLAALLLVPLSGYACMVVGVSDGDTLTVQCEGTRSRVHLADIDAPELGQRHGDLAKRSLSDMCYRRTAQILERYKNKYGDLIASVTCDDVHASTEQLRRGMAWVANEPSTDRTLYVAQDVARHAGRGLWESQSAVPPWEWRQAQQEKARKAALLARKKQQEEDERKNAVVAFFQRLFSFE